MKTYEGMFLLDAGQTDFEEATQPIQAVLDRNGAEEAQIKKWDERRLAYEIKGRRRGMYVLTYFRAAPEAIADIERDVQLNETILRVLILSADHVGAEKMATPTPAEAEDNRRQTEEAAAAEKARLAEAVALAPEPAEEPAPEPAKEAAPEPIEAPEPGPAEEPALELDRDAAPEPAEEPAPEPAEEPGTEPADDTKPAE